MAHQAMAVDRELREGRNGHRAAILLLTGLSGAGKSTWAQALEAELLARGAQSYVLDGDRLRQGLNAGLGFSPADRRENVRRAGEAAQLLADAGQIVILALIAPLAEYRELLRAQSRVPFFEIWCSAALEVCEARDCKGLYARARAGELAEFTGISAPYETPRQPDLVLDSATLSVAEGVERLLGLLRRQGILAG